MPQPMHDISSVTNILHNAPSKIGI